MQHLLLFRAFWMAFGALGSASFCAGCSTPDCVSDDEYKEALAQGIAVDLLRCPIQVPSSVTAACTPSSLEASLVNECGIFASNSMGDDDNPGTMERPVKSIAEAITLARVGGGTRVIYLCGENFDVELAWPEDAGGGNKGVVLFGGLKCDDISWAYQPNIKTVLTAPEGKAPMRINGVLGPVDIYDMHIEAKSALPGKDGQSSIALMVNEAALSLYRSSVIAGDGAPGSSGAPAQAAAQSGLNGNPGANLCGTVAETPTAAPTLDCGGGVSSKGGFGGSGGVNKGFDGAPGSPLMGQNAGLGEPEAGGDCTDGRSGDAGIDGAQGIVASGIGTLDWLTGFQGIWGGDGQAGTPGQGGGGGGGRDNPGGICTGKNGAGGGSGATGGCGGQGGKGGGPGGVSIAIMSFGSTIRLFATNIQSGNGGAPGLGAQGQEGGIGGIGGLGGQAPNKPSINIGCRGGDGGKGAKGGNGANGLGGHSIGIAYMGAQVPQFLDGSTISQAGMAGEGGVVEDMQSF